MSSFCGQDIIDCIEQMKYTLLTYSFSTSTKIEVSIEAIEADPGNGKMIDILIIRSVDKPDKDGRQKSITAEILPFSENVSPRISSVDSYNLRKQVK